MDLFKPRVAIIQARMGSTRLPGKVLKEVLGKPLLFYLIERVKKAKTLDKIVIATTTKKQDDPIFDLAKDLGVATFRGSEENVLERYYLSALEQRAKTVIRITSDCPLIDHEVIDRTIKAFCSSTPTVDYLSNCTFRMYPRGMDTEVFTFKALDEAFHHHTTFHEQEHVTPYIYNHPEKFRLGQITYHKDYHKIRLTEDTIEDFQLIKLIFEELYPKNPDFSLEDILAFLEKNPELLKINEHVKQKA